MPIPSRKYRPSARGVSMSSAYSPFADRTLVVSGGSLRHRPGHRAGRRPARRQRACCWPRPPNPTPSCPAPCTPRWPRSRPSAPRRVAGGGRRPQGRGRAARRRRRGRDTSAGSTSSSTTPARSPTEPTEELAAKKFDLMMDINVRGTFLLTKAALPHLRKSGERPRHHPGAAAEPEPVLAGRAPVLHAVEVRDDAAVAGLGRRVRRTRIGFSCLWPRPTSPPPR